jgi:hypothetical protein
MKIETWLQPNCSEAVIVVVDWTKKQIIESYEAVSDGCDNEGERDRIKGFVEYMQSGYEIDINANGTDMFKQEYNIADAIVKNDKVVRDWDKLTEAFMKGDGDSVLKHLDEFCEDKVEQFAKGKFKKKGGKK